MIGEILEAGCAAGSAGEAGSSDGRGATSPKREWGAPVALVLRVAALAGGAAESEILGRRRCRTAVVRSRHIAMYLLHTVFRFNYREVGEIFARDRRTVARACAAVEKSRDRAAHDAELSALEALLELASVQPSVCRSCGDNPLVVRRECGN